MVIIKQLLYYTKYFNLRCQKYTFRCNYGACVSKESKCDGVKQCADGSDEENCVDRNPISQPITVKPVNNTTQPTTQSNTKYIFYFVLV